MSNRLLIVDDFLPDPHGFREELLHNSFVDIRFVDGQTYKRIQVRSTDEHRALLEKAVGRKVEQEYSFVRLNFTGELPNNSIHSDAYCGGHVALLYLNLPEQCRGGTALWKHRGTGYDALPTEHDVRRAGKSPVQLMKKLVPDYNRVEAWEQVGLAEMAFNRLAIHPTANFHSRWPFEAFGTTPQDGRLVWISFFKCV